MTLTSSLNYFWTSVVKNIHSWASTGWFEVKEVDMNGWDHGQIHFSCWDFFNQHLPPFHYVLCGIPVLEYLTAPGIFELVI